MRTFPPHNTTPSTPATVGGRNHLVIIIYKKDKIIIINSSLRWIASLTFRSEMRSAHKHYGFHLKEINLFSGLASGGLIDFAIFPRAKRKRWVSRPPGGVEVTNLRQTYRSHVSILAQPHVMAMASSHPK